VAQLGLSAPAHPTRAHSLRKTIGDWHVKFDRETFGSNHPLALRVEKDQLHFYCVFSKKPTILCHKSAIVQISWI
jgi:hypothetical protein